jgi:hypothetical protein
LLKALLSAAKTIAVTAINTADAKRFIHPPFAVSAAGLKTSKIAFL